MPDTPTSPPAAPTTILGRHKGKAAGAAAMIPLLYALVDCYTTAQHNKAAIHRTETHYVDTDDWLAGRKADMEQVERMIRLAHFGPTNR